MSSEDIQHCYLCSDGKVTAIFVSPTRVGVDKLRNKFKLKAQGRSVVFNPSSPGECCPRAFKHFKYSTLWLCMFPHISLSFTCAGMNIYKRAQGPICDCVELLACYTCLLRLF